MSGIVLDKINKKYESEQVLKDISLSIQSGEFLTLLGPSGCGKSTLLKILAGLEKQDSGQIKIDEKMVDNVRPSSRNVAMVFQSYALYPHMTVAQNIGTPLRMRQMTRIQRLPVVGNLLPNARRIKKSIAEKVSDTARALEIEHLLDRRPHHISGGQRQRVALGRAMVRSPSVFLMDEPLSNLDANLRATMRAEIKDLHQRTGSTFVYVTHDQSEAMTLSDRIAVMSQGKIMQVGTPDAIYYEPETRDVAKFLGSNKINFTNAISLGPVGIKACGVLIPIITSVPEGTPITLAVRPESLDLVGERDETTISARITLLENLGADILAHVLVDNDETKLVMRLQTQSHRSLKAGSCVNVSMPHTEIMLFQADGSRIETTVPEPQRVLSIA